MTDQQLPEPFQFDVDFGAPVNTADRAATVGSSVAPFLAEPAVAPVRPVAKVRRGREFGEVVTSFMKKLGCAVVAVVFLIVAAIVLTVVMKTITGLDHPVDPTGIVAPQLGVNPDQDPPAASDPAPAAPIPLPSPELVTPGAFCTDPSATGVSKKGDSYMCGADGPDAAGRLHWNN